MLPYSTNKAPAEATERPSVASPNSVQQMLSTLKRYASSRVCLYILITLFVGCSVLFFGYVTGGGNLDGIIRASVAVIPFILLWSISLLITSPEQLSRWVMFFATLWGGLGATLLTVSIVTFNSEIFGPATTQDSVVVQAAVVEEIAKGLFLLVLLWVACKHIRTAYQGAILGGLVGAGFAFIENIQYYNMSFNAGGLEVFWVTVFQRGVMSIFLHPFCTMLTGMLIGYGVQKNYKRWVVSLISLFGLAAAMTLHGLWNGLSTLSSDINQWYMHYGFFWIPMFLTIIIILIVLKRQDKLTMDDPQKV